MSPSDIDPAKAAQGWLDEFAAAIADRDEGALRELVHADCYWRDLVALTGGIQTISGAENVIPKLVSLADAANAVDFKLLEGFTEPSWQPRGDREVVEAIFGFETDMFRGKGVVRLTPAESAQTEMRAWALLTTAQELKGYEEPIEERRPEHLDRRAWSFDEGDPDVLIVGAGQSGLCLAARLRLMGVPTLVVEKNERVGDNWRKRYHSLTLHNIIQVNQFPFLPFPTSWPTYLPKDLYGDWLETFGHSMDVDVWTATTFRGGEYDEGEGRWTVRVEREGGAQRVLRPKHVVMATGGFACVPRIPDIAGLDEFGGTVVHTTQVKGGADFAGRKVIVIGSGTSAHDLSVELISHGSQVTMVQRSPTDVISQPAANIFLSLFVERPAPEVDLVLAANRVDVTRNVFRQLTQIAADMDRELIQGLEAVGFRTCRGVDDAGYFWDFLERGGGYYIDVGGSKYILDGTVRVVQAADIATYGPKGAYLSDGSTVEADAIILATGFANQELEVRDLFGDEVAEKVGPIWGYGEDGELRNTWVPTGQDGLWFMGGGIPHARDYSRYVALQITMRLLGLTIGTPGALVSS